MKFSAFGFTLVELLVVIAIMAIIGAYTLANYRPFGEDQSLKSAVLDIQSILRQAQAGATTNAICNTQSSATWQVEFANTTTINLKCQESAVLFQKKLLSLDTTNITITSFSWTGSSCPIDLPIVKFILLSGKIDFGNANCTTLTITLKNNKTQNTKTLTIEQGGRIYGQ